MAESSDSEEESVFIFLRLEWNFELYGTTRRSVCRFDRLYSEPPKF
jgi:hypothetical protein